MGYEDNAKFKNHGRFVMMGSVHGGFTNCGNELPGILVKMDDRSILEFLYKEIFQTDITCNEEGSVYGYKENGTCTCRSEFFGDRCNKAKSGNQDLLEGIMIKTDFLEDVETGRNL